MEGEQEEFKRQLEYIIKQLNKNEDEFDVGDYDSDDEGDEDDDEVNSSLRVQNRKKRSLVRIFS